VFLEDEGMLHDPAAVVGGLEGGRDHQLGRVDARGGAHGAHGGDGDDHGEVGEEVSL